MIAFTCNGLRAPRVDDTALANVCSRLIR